MFRSAKFILYLSEKAFREQRFATPVLFHLRNLIIRQSEKQYRLAVGFKIVSDGKQRKATYAYPVWPSSGNNLSNPDCRNQKEEERIAGKVV